MTIARLQLNEAPVMTEYRGMAENDDIDDSGIAGAKAGVNASVNASVEVDTSTDGSATEQASGTSDSLRTAYFAGGCFWGLEHYFQQVDGVVDVHSGYAQSNIPNPSYEVVCSGVTDAAETVHVTYDPRKVSLQVLALLLIDVIDPYSTDGQGHDTGRQYRSGLFWTTPEQQRVFEQVIARFNERSSRPAGIEVTQLRNFYEAEDYHQDYLDKNPGGYCHVPLNKIANVATRQKYIERVSQLSPLQYSVTQEADTEQPFTNEYDALYEPGLYVDIVSGEPLFTSDDKFDSGCGWPSFSKPLDDSKLRYLDDHRVPGRDRIEVRVVDSGIHLGHVFDDGPKELGGKRYCMNSASLRFIPKSRMAAEGYGEYLDRVR